MELCNADCLKYLPMMLDKSIDITFTSPPYNRKRNDKYKNYNDCNNDYYNFLIAFTEEVLRISKKYCIINIQTNYYNKIDVYKYIGNYANKIQQIIIWEKTNPMPATGFNITNAYEYFIVLGDMPLKSNETYTKNHITTSKNNKTMSIHKAIMKQEVADWFIKMFTKENDIILDPFMGIGTTAISCKKFNRQFIGIEINKDYFDIAKENINGK